ncbi:MAG: hypothetical protein JWO03_68 [Bacteroidetes bacterium]|nr:hypothetical protein [Bacteroidota bacterium]
MSLLYALYTITYIRIFVILSESEGSLSACRALLLEYTIRPTILLSVQPREG